MILKNIKNFHPISNLPFLANILELVVATQLISNLTENNLFEPLQSGFCKFRPSFSSLLIVRLETGFGVCDTVLNWFKSYLTDRKQFVTMGGF